MGKDQLASIASISKTRANDLIKITEIFTSLLAKDLLSEGLILAYESVFYACGLAIGKVVSTAGKGFEILFTKQRLMSK